MTNTRLTESIRIIRFAIIGIFNTTFDFALFVFLYSYVNVHEIPANVLAFSVVVTVSFFLNRRWSFAHPNPPPVRLRQFATFVSASTFSVLLSTSILAFGQSIAPVLELKLFATLIGPLVNYLAYRYLVFAPPRE